MIDEPVIIHRDEAGRFGPGTIANPSGRAKGVLYPGEALKMLLKTDEHGVPAWPPAKIREMVKDETAHPALIAAGRELLTAMSDGKKWILDKGGKAWLAGVDPEIGRAFDRAACRLEGKPVQAVFVTTEHVSRPADLASDAIALIRQDPRLIRPLWPRLLAMTRYAPTIREQLRPILQQHAPDLVAALDPVDSTATELDEPAVDVPGALLSPAEQDNLIVADMAKANQRASDESDPPPAAPFPDAEAPIERSRLPFTPPQEGQSYG